MPIKSVKMKISKNKNMHFFSCPKDHSTLGQKVCHVGCWHTDTRTHRQSDYCGHPFRVSGFYPSTYHQGSAQKTWSNRTTLVIPGTYHDLVTFYIYITDQVGHHCEHDIWCLWRHQTMIFFIAARRTNLTDIYITLSVSHTPAQPHTSTHDKIQVTSLGQFVM